MIKSVCILTLMIPKHKGGLNKQGVAGDICEPVRGHTQHLRVRYDANLKDATHPEFEEDTYASHLDCSSHMSEQQPPLFKSSLAGAI